MNHDDDELLSEPLPVRRRGALMTRTGTGLAAVIIAGAGFLGGVQVQKASGDDGGGNTGFAGGFPGGGMTRGGGAPTGGVPGGSGGAGGQAQGGGTVGEVASVDGSTFYVEDSSGNTIRVRAGKKAKVSRNATAGAEEIHPGDTVIVQGETADSGTIVATSVTATASNVEGAGAFGGFGGGAPPTGTAPGGG